MSKRLRSAAARAFSASAARMEAAAAAALAAARLRCAANWPSAASAVCTSALAEARFCAYSSSSIAHQRLAGADLLVVAHQDRRDEAVDFRRDERGIRLQISVVGGDAGGRQRDPPRARERQRDRRARHDQRAARNASPPHRHGRRGDSGLLEYGGAHLSNTRQVVVAVAQSFPFLSSRRPSAKAARRPSEITLPSARTGPEVSLSAR